MTLSFITEETQNILEKAETPQEYYNVPNDHPALPSEQKTLLEVIATHFGIQLDATGYTFKLKQGKDGDDNTIFLPQVEKDAEHGVVLAWGKLKIPLTQDQLREMSVGLVNKRLVLEVYMEHFEDYIALPMNLVRMKPEEVTKETPEETAKYVKTKPDDRRVLIGLALKSKTLKLHHYLSEGYSKPIGLADLEVGKEYKVVGYVRDKQYGKVRLILEGVNEQVRSNTRIEEILSADPEITPDKPALLRTRESTGTHNGHPVIPVSLKTWKAIQAPKVKFGATEENVTEVDELAAVA